MLALGRRRRSSGRPRASRPFFARWYGVAARLAERGEVGRRRRVLLAHAGGRVLEVGVGTGENFKHLPASVTGVVAVDADPAMLRRARPRLVEAPARASLGCALAERLPFAAASFDTVVVTLVLCSVDEPTKAASELFRVLRPGGRLLVMEHVRSADEDIARLQDWFERPWGWVAGGCHPNRPTLQVLEQAGFRLGPFERYGFALALPHVQGVAVRP